MTKVVKFPNPVPEKFGPQRVGRRKGSNLEKHGQLNLFSGGKVISLHQLTPFEEAMLHDEKGDWAAARLSYQKAIGEQDSVADAYCNLGIIEFQEGHYPKSIDCFTRSLKEEPRHFEAHYNLANLYAEMGDFALAKFHYQISIEIDPDFRNSYFNLGLAFAMAKEYPEAIRILEQYKQLAPAAEHKQADDLISSMKTMSK